MNGWINEARSRPPDRWPIILDLGVQPGTGRRKQKWITARGTRTDAERKLRDLIGDADRGEFVEPSKRTLGLWLDEWLQAIKEDPDRRPRTHQTYEIAVRLHLKPGLGHLRLQQLSRMDVKRYHSARLALERSRPQRLTLTRADRLLWAWVSRLWKDWRRGLVIVKPDTVIRWHRKGFRLLWTWKSRRRLGRPTVSPDVRILIRTMSDANPLWGAPRIHGELLKLGIAISQASVAKYMIRRRPPSPTWRTFLANHVTQLTAADFFVVPTATYRLLFVLVILAHDRRRVVHLAVTAHPTAAWTAQQLREAFLWDETLDI